MNEEQARNIVKALEAVTTTMLAFATVVSRRMSAQDRSALETDLAVLTREVMAKNGSPELETMLILLHQAIHQAPDAHQAPAG